MKYLLHTTLAFLAATSIQYSNTEINQETTLKQIETLCVSWHADPANSALIQNIFKAETDPNQVINPSDLDSLLELVATVEQLEKELLKSGLSSVQARLKSFDIFATTLCNHLSDNQRLSLNQLLEIDNQELDTQLETAAALLMTSSETDKQFDLNAQPEAQYFLFMYSLRKQLVSN